MPPTPERPAAGPSPRYHYAIEKILRSPKHMDHCKVLDRLSRFQTVLARKTDWQPLAFSGRRVVEIGAGPLLGMAPIALFLGAS